MGIKSVPQAVLRKQFSDAATIFIEILDKYAQTENGALLRSAIGCLSVLLRAQEYALWSESSTMRVFGSVTEGVFEGKIIAHDGAYYVEHARRYFPPNSTRTRAHSVIYKDGDVTDPYANRRHGKFYQEAYE
ncbi:RRP12-like protein [Operophtera brumata]|uniref:RRP12-like protein n=1 Tax=Operophtera brumata TaxID=104452 RepID=A0A0L7LTN6_OPEBR|nr:RRP12-like protein [Operophtera brumata]